MTLLLLASCFVAGVFAGLWAEAPPAAVVLLASAAVLLALLSRVLRRTVFVSVLLLAAVAGILRVESLPWVPGEGLREHYDVPTDVTGVVAADPDPAGSLIRVVLEVESVGSGGGRADRSGRVLVTMRIPAGIVAARDAPHIRYGDRLRLTGRLLPPPELDGFDYPGYLASQGIGTTMWLPDVELVDEGNGSRAMGLVYGLRRTLSQSLGRVVADPQAALGQALLLGMRDGLPDEMVEEFRETGTSHLLAISGMHVGILLGIGLAASQWLLGRRRHYYLLAPLVLIWGYALLSGMSPSAVRATIMGTVYLAALALGRPKAVLPALGLAAAVMVAVHPMVLTSVAFQLSFAAMAGIATVARPLGDRLIAVMQPGAASRGGAEPSRRVRRILDSDDRGRDVGDPPAGRPLLRARAAGGRSGHDAGASSAPGRAGFPRCRGVCRISGGLARRSVRLGGVADFVVRDCRCRRPREAAGRFHRDGGGQPLRGGNELRDPRCGVRAVPAPGPACACGSGSEERDAQAAGFEPEVGHGGGGNCGCRGLGRRSGDARRAHARGLR